MNRDRKGRFVKYRARAMATKRRRARAPKRSHKVHGYSMRRKGRTVHVAPHTSRQASQPRRRRRRSRRASAPRARAYAPARRRSRRRGGGEHVVVVANAPRVRHRYMRRYGRARTPPLFTVPGMLVFGVGGVFGMEAADLTARYFLGIDPTTTPLPTGVTSIATYNDAVMAAPPSLKRVGIELGIGLLGWIGGGLAAKAGMSLLSLFGYGWGFGATFHIGSAVIDGYLLQPLFVGTGTTPNNIGARMFQHEINAAAARTTTVNAGGTLGAPPTHRAGTPVLPAGRPAAHIPAALAQLGPSRVGQPAYAYANGSNGNGQPAYANAGGMTSQGNCLPPGVQATTVMRCGSGCRCQTCAPCSQPQQPPPPPGQTYSPPPPPPQQVTPPPPPVVCPPGQSPVQQQDGTFVCQPTMQPFLPIPTQTNVAPPPPPYPTLQGLGDPSAAADPYQHPMTRTMLGGARRLRRAA